MQRSRPAFGQQIFGAVLLLDSCCRDEVEQDSELRVHLNHPALVTLRNRLTHLLRPCFSTGDAVVTVQHVHGDGNVVSDAKPDKDVAMDDLFESAAARLAGQGEFRHALVVQPSKLICDEDKLAVICHQHTVLRLLCWHFKQEAAHNPA